MARTYWPLPAILLLATCIAPSNGAAVVGEQCGTVSVVARADVDGDNRVVTVEPNSAAEAAGLQFGDILLKLRPAGEATNAATAVPFTDREAAANLVSSTNDGLAEEDAATVPQKGAALRALTLTLQRDDQVMEVNITPGLARMYPPGTPRPTPRRERCADDEARLCIANW